MNITLRHSVSKRTSLALALGLALAGAAIAQTAPTAAQQQELDAARANLDQAARRYGELARKYGGADAPIRIEKHMLRKPVIGVLLAPDDDAGARIAGVTPDSAAAAVGLKSGDRIVGIDGKPLKAASGVARVDEARALLGAGDTKTPMKLAFERDGKQQVVTLTPKIGDRLLVVPRGSTFDGNVQVFAGGAGTIEVTADRIHAGAGDAAIAPGVRNEIIQLGSNCFGDDCELPMLAEAFRWNGLNLAAVDTQLGRYFGTSDGVLVLSTGKDLEGLQAGDVIRKIGGKPVNSPREAMEALRAQPADGKVAVDYLRDRKAGTAQVSVPKALPFTLPRAAMAPHAPGMPGAVEHRKMVFVGEGGKVQAWEDGDGKAPPAWVAEGPKDGKRVEKRKYVVIDQDGKRREWEGAAGDTPPAWVQALPAEGKRIEKRVQVIVDDKGNKTVIEADELPPPPPAPPAPPKVD